MSVANVVMFEFETSEDLENWAKWYKNNGPFPQQEINVFLKLVKHPHLELRPIQTKKQEKQAEGFVMI